MSIFRINKDKNNNYVMLNKQFLGDSNLSWKAKGLLAYLLSLPDDWQIYEKELVTHSTDKRDSTRTAIKELIDNKYIERVRTRDDKGRLSNYEYNVFENPNQSGKTNIGKTNVGKTNIGKTNIGKTNIGKTPPTNNNLTNNNLTNNNSTSSSSRDTKNNSYIDFFNNNFHPITPFELETLDSYINDGLQEEVIKIALIEAIENNRRDIRYVKKILNRWLENNLLTVEAVKADKAKWERNKKGVKKNGFNKQSPQSEDVDGIGIEL